MGETLQGAVDKEFRELVRGLVARPSYADRFNEIVKTAGLALSLGLQATLAEALVAAGPRPAAEIAETTPLLTRQRSRCSRWSATSTSASSS